MSKLALVALLPLLAVGAVVLALLSLWSVERAPETMRKTTWRRTTPASLRRWPSTPALARAA